MLYLKDYANKDYLIDTTTKNLSFIRMSVMLSRMGIKNNKFMLLLVQRELQGVDPYDPNISEELALKIAAECVINPWYFFREIIRIPEQGGDPVRYILNRANLALIWLFLNNTHIFLTMPRQIGKTIGTIGLIAYLMFVRAKKLNIGLFAKGNQLRMENVSRLKALRDALPSCIVRKGPAYNTDNQESFEYKPLDNKYICFVAQKDRKAAAGQGRGESLALEHWDELAYYVNNDVSYQSAITAAAAALDQVRKNGVPCANIITTTAGLVDDDCGKYAYGIKDQCLRFDEAIYDMEDHAALTAVLKRASTNNMVYIEMSYKQLGKSEEWLKEKTVGLSQEVIDTDFLNRWIHGAGGSILPKATLDKLRIHIKEPVAITFEESTMFRWYADPEYVKLHMQHAPLILSSDTSDNVGRDWTTLVLLNPIDMRVLMTCRCNEVNLAYVATVIVKMLQHYSRLVFIPERNKNGAMLIDFILHAMECDPNFNPFKRIYNSYVQNYHKESQDFDKLDLADGKVRKNFGFNTTSSDTSRKLLYSAVLTTTVNKNYSRIYDATIVDEICGLIVKNGRIDHVSGSHDDLLVAYLIAAWLVMYGRNHHMYGIRPDELLSAIDDDGSVVAPGDKHLQREYKQKLETINKALEGNPSPIVRLALERDKRLLEAMIRKTGGVDSVISLHQVGVEAAQKKAHNSINPAVALQQLTNFF